jgi:hypothetical protein
MKYVLDSSVALKWVLPEADSAKALGQRDEYKTGVHELYAEGRGFAGVAASVTAARAALSRRRTLGRFRDATHARGPCA